MNMKTEREYGMPIHYHPIFTNSFKFNSYTLNFLLPLSEENATCCALLAQILKRGCKKYGEMDRIAARLEELYGASVSISSDKIGENLSFTVQAYFIDDRFTLEGEKITEDVLDLTAELLLNPLTSDGGFKQDFFDQEKQNHFDFIAGLINDKRMYSMIRCKEIMFSDSVYRFTSAGSLECLEKLTNQKLFTFYQNMLKNSEVTVTYIGRELDLSALTEKYFPVENNDLALKGSGKIVVPEQPNYISEAFDVAQGKLCLGYRFVKETEYYATRLFNVIFGGSPTSKLFNNVRERLSLCYYCSSTVDHCVHSMFISSGIEFKNYDVAKQEIFHQLEDMKIGNITEEEFENGKLYLIDVIKGMRDSHGALLADVLRGKLLGISDSIEQQIEKISKLNKQDIMAVAECAALDTVYFLKGHEV